MAVKPITNPNPKTPEQVDRSAEISGKDLAPDRGAGRSSNDQQVVTPGKDFTENYQIIIKDLDTAIMTHIKNVMNLKVRENGELVDVPVMYGNEERWANVRKNGTLRDKNGALILPLMMFKRNSVEFNETLPSWKHDFWTQGQPYGVQSLMSSKWSQQNQYSRFNIEQGISPVREQIVTATPQYVNTNYQFSVASAYITQMNTIIESFVQQHKTYWGDNTSYRFLCTVEGGMEDATEMEVNGERIIKTNFNVMLRGYLIPQTVASVVEQVKFATRKELTTSRITFSENIE